MRDKKVTVTEKTMCIGSNIELLNLTFHAPSELSVYVEEIILFNRKKTDRKPSNPKPKLAAWRNANNTVSVPTATCNSLKTLHSLPFDFSTNRDMLKSH